MEGPLSLPKTDPKKGRGLLYATMFVMGAALEYVMCKTGFYTVVNKSEGKKEAAKKMEQKAFWDRVEARRDKRANAIEIREPELDQ